MVVAVVLGLAITACGADTGPLAESGPVAVTLRDYTVTPSRPTARAGQVTFDITNAATDMTHEMLVLKTDLDPADLPLDQDGSVDERGEGVEFIDERENLTPGAQASLTVDLAPGRYVLLCNLDDHYARGMYVSFEVMA